MRDGEKGPVDIEMVIRRVQTRLERKRTGPNEWLVVTRRPLSDTRALEPQGSPDATDQDAHYRYRYYCSPTGVSAGELAAPSLAELARVIKAGACIEASFKRGKGEAGMDEYQVRTWQGWHHHMALSLMAVWFLIGETHRGQQVTPALTLPQVRYGLSLLLLEVFYTPGVDNICRQVQRQLLRNELARFYHHRTRKSHIPHPSDGDPPIFPGHVSHGQQTPTVVCCHRMRGDTPNAFASGAWYGARSPAHRSVPGPTSAHCEGLCRQDWFGRDDQSVGTDGDGD